MLNNSFRKEALSELEGAHNRYEIRAELVGEQSIELMTLRKESSEKLIKEVEVYINTLANTPKELDKSFAEYKASFSSFNTIIARINKDAVTADIQTGSGVGASVAAGVGVAALAPTAAMAVATTFGVASTGTAISALSGAAATNAALAWLGGGAIVAGGGGMAGGSTLLALAGPVGWAVGGLLLAGTGVFSYRKNKRIGEEAIARRKEIETFDSALKAALKEINSLINLTNTHVQGVRQLLGKLLNCHSKDYKTFTLQEKQEVGSLVNHINSLSALLNKKVDA